MHPARMLVLAATLAACTRQPSATLELEDPQDSHEPAARSEPADDPNQQLEARMQSVCAHSYAVLEDESGIL